MARAISSGSPRAQWHCRRQRRLPLRGSGEAVKHSGVCRTGATALTRTPKRAASSAADFVMPSTACLLAA